MDRLAEAIKLALAAEGHSLGRTKLVKLLFLADLEATRQGLPPFTDGKWTYDHYGPFNWDVPDTADELARHGEVCRENWEDQASGYAGTDYAAPGAVASTVELAPADRQVVEAVVAHWRGRSLRDIKKHVYELSIIASNERGETFDMAADGWRDELAFYDALDETQTALAPYLTDLGE